MTQVPSPPAGRTSSRSVPRNRNTAWGAELFYYNSGTGEAALGAFQEDGSHVTSLIFPAGTLFRPGWSHVLGDFHAQGTALFFYDAQTGEAETGRITTSWLADDPSRYGFFSREGFRLGNGWTHVLMTCPYFNTVFPLLLFYCSANGLARVAWLKQNHPILGEPDPYGSPQGDLHQLSPGWTHVVNAAYRRPETGEDRREFGVGILFYNYDTGNYAVGDVTLDRGVPRIDMRVEGAGWHYDLQRPTWTNIGELTQGLLFYERFGSRVMVAYLLHEAECAFHGHAPLVIKKKLNSFIPGGASYTHVVFY